jgi:transposase
MDLVACLLPDGPLLHLETWHLDEAAAQLTLCLTSTQALVHCPVCQCPTQHIHSHYTYCLSRRNFRGGMHLRVR